MRFFARLGILGVWALGLVLETLIKVHVTGVRPHPDKRPQQVLVMMGIAGAIALLVRWRDERFRWTAAWSALGLVLTVALALAGMSSPPKAGLIMLVTTWLGVVADRRSS